MGEWSVAGAFFLQLVKSCAEQETWALALTCLCRPPRLHLPCLQEHVPCNLLELLEAQPGGMDSEAVRLIVYQLCSAISFIHSKVSMSECQLHVPHIHGGHSYWWPVESAPAIAFPVRSRNGPMFLGGSSRCYCTVPTIYQAFAQSKQAYNSTYKDKLSAPQAMMCLCTVPVHCACAL